MSRGQTKMERKKILSYKYLKKKWYERHGVTVLNPFRPHFDELGAKKKPKDKKRQARKHTRVYIFIFMYM